MNMNQVYGLAGSARREVWESEVDRLLARSENMRPDVLLSVLAREMGHPNTREEELEIEAAGKYILETGYSGLV